MRLVPPTVMTSLPVSSATHSPPLEKGVNGSTRLQDEASLWESTWASDKRFTVKATAPNLCQGAFSLMYLHARAVVQGKRKVLFRTPTIGPWPYPPENHWCEASVRAPRVLAGMTSGVRDSTRKTSSGDRLPEGNCDMASYASFSHSGASSPGGCDKTPEGTTSP